MRQRLELTGEADSARAVVSAGHVLAGSAIHARIGFTFIVIDVAVRATPAGVAGTFVANAKGNVLFREFHSWKLQAAHAR